MGGLEVMSHRLLFWNNNIIILANHRYFQGFKSSSGWGRSLVHTVSSLFLSVSLIISPSLFFFSPRLSFSNPFPLYTSSSSSGCQIWNRHWRPCLSKHLCHQTTSKNLKPLLCPPVAELQRLSRNVIRCLPLSRLPSTLPVKDKNSKPLRLHTCPKNSICLFLIVFNSDL